MKKFYIILLVLFLVNTACQRSQFATTTRHSSNGRVTYINHYPAERSRLSKVKFPNNHLNETKAQYNPPAPDKTEVEKLQEPDIITINSVPISEHKNLIASTSNEPIIIASDENRGVVDHNLILLDKSLYVFKTGKSNPDTVRDSASKKGITKVHVAKIKFKNGHVEKVTILYQNHDTLKYQLIDESDATRIVMMDKVDTIILPDTRNTEKNGVAGFILSILGLFPVIGLPFAILGVIFGVKSLRKIRQDSARYKGKVFAKISFILGVIGLSVTLLSIALFISLFM